MVDVSPQHLRLRVDRHPREPSVQHQQRQVQSWGVKTAADSKWSRDRAWAWPLLLGRCGAAFCGSADSGSQIEAGGSGCRGWPGSAAVQTGPRGQRRRSHGLCHMPLLQRPPVISDTR